MTLTVACLLAWLVLIAAVLVFFRSAAKLNEKDEHEEGV